MKKIFKTFEAEMRQISAPEKDCWISLVKPTEKELARRSGMTKTLCVPLAAGSHGSSQSCSQVIGPKATASAA